ncbi:hypothetical protein SELMODRAFT_419035 [Selaginella moellendorffii]|uniref:Uncharacterized protein n=1 Tax=Selaginella moellendorffii TaxID=88036 RepID=D8S7M0_SELML|nr:hypothetical protein SELMODRAFT_419035 [Selaginella moellendorffii]
MDPQNRGSGSARLLGYTSRLARPRSMRARRVRCLKEKSGTIQQVKQGTEFFELLAAVAGQFLQDGGEPERGGDGSKPASKHGGSFRKRRYSSFSHKGSKRTKAADDLGSASQASPSMMSLDFEAKPGTSTPTLSGASSPRKTVKLSIKSFTVPELLIDMPESATKAVLDATTNLLGGGLKIRVFLHGKRVPDEEATLAQVGLSQNGKAGSLGFMLEPASSSSCEGPLLALSQQGSWYTADGSWVVEDQEKTEDNAEQKPDIDAKWTGTHLVLQGYKNKFQSVTDERTYKARFGETTSPQPDIKQCEATSPSLMRALPLSEAEGPGGLVQRAADNSQGLALVSLQKQMSLEGTKRRIRRPFTIAEVEALVFAVEKLGLGRWRDVKLWAFDQAKHRTYVDLKDKWKTLVHTARIAPHQRRGEPVPEELLERVIKAQDYWTARQAKQQAESTAAT